METDEHKTTSCRLWWNFIQLPFDSSRTSSSSLPPMSLLYINYVSQRRYIFTDLTLGTRMWHSVRDVGRIRSFVRFHCANIFFGLSSYTSENTAWDKICDKIFSTFSFVVYARIVTSSSCCSYCVCVWLTQDENGAEQWRWGEKGRFWFWCL